MSAEWLSALAAAGDAWATAMGRAAVQGGLAVAVVWLVCRAFPTLPGQVRCWLWRLAYLRLLMALCFPYALELPLLPAPPPAPVVAEPQALLPALSAAAETSSDTPLVTVRPVPSPAEGMPPWSLWLAGLWLAGAAGCAIRICRQCQRAARLRAQAVRLEDHDVLDRWDALCCRAGVRRAPELRSLEGLDGPVLLGGLRPMVALPPDLLRDWPREQLELALAHELAHVKRADLLWSWLPALTHVGFYFHPLFWLAAREWRLARELACDALALRLTRGSAGDYASMLVRLASQRSHQGALAMAGTLWIASESPDCLRRRVQAMKDTRNVSRNRMLLLGSMSLLLGGVLLTPFQVVAQSPDVPDQTPEEQPVVTGRRSVRQPADPTQAGKRPGDDPRYWQEADLITLNLRGVSMSQLARVISRFPLKKQPEIVFDSASEGLRGRKIRSLSVRNKSVLKTLQLACKSAGGYVRQDAEGVYHLSLRPFEKGRRSNVDSEAEGDAITLEMRNISFAQLVRQISRMPLQNEPSIVFDPPSEGLENRKIAFISIRGKSIQKALEIACKAVDAYVERDSEGVYHLSSSPFPASDRATSDVAAEAVNLSQVEQDRRVAQARAVAAERQAALDADWAQREAKQVRQQHQNEAAEAAEAAKHAAREAARAQLEAQRAAAQARLQEMDAELAERRRTRGEQHPKVEEARARQDAVLQALQEQEAQLAEARKALAEATVAAREQALAAEAQARATQKQAEVAARAEKTRVFRDRATAEELSRPVFRGSSAEWRRRKELMQRRGLGLRADTLPGRSSLRREIDASRQLSREALFDAFVADRLSANAGMKLDGSLRRELDALPPKQRAELERKLQRIPADVERSIREARRSLDADGKRLDAFQRQRLLEELKRLQERIRAELSRTLGKEVPGEPAEKEVR